MDLDPQLPTHSPSAAYFHDADRPLRTLGVIAMIISLLVGFVLMFVGIGVGLSSGPDPSSSVRHVWTLWNWTGGLTAAALGAGLVTTVAGERRRAPRVRALLAGATGALLIVSVVAGTLLWMTTTGS